MKKNELLQIIEDFNESRCHTSLMYDTADDTYWLDYHSGAGEYNVYHQDTIYTIIRKWDLYYPAIDIDTVITIHDECGPPHNIDY